VYGTDPQRPIILPATDLYEFNPTLFDQLATASAAGDVEQLKSLWAKAGRFQPDARPAGV